MVYSVSCIKHKLLTSCNEKNSLLSFFCLFQAQEREHQEKINDDAKDLEKMTNKQSLLLKKVGLPVCVKLTYLLQSYT